MVDELFIESVFIDNTMKKIFLALLASILFLNISGQYNNPKTALLVIDIQDFYFPGGDMPLHKPKETAARAATLIEHFRDKKDEVIYIRHNYEPGGTIYESVRPQADEKIFDKNNVNSFLGTDL